MKEKKSDQKRHQVDDSEPTAYGAGIAFGAEFGEGREGPSQANKGAGLAGAVALLGSW